MTQRDLLFRIFDLTIKMQCRDMEDLRWARILKVVDNGILKPVLKINCIEKIINSEA